MPPAASIGRDAPVLTDGRPAAAPDRGLLNVLHLRSCANLGSPEKLVLGRAPAASRMGIRYEVCVFDEHRGAGANPFLEELAARGITAWRLGGGRGDFFRNLGRLGGVVRSSRPDVLCTHDYKSALHGFLLGRRFGIPLMTVYHGKTTKDAKLALYYAVYDRLLGRHDGIVCVSRPQQEDLASRFPSPLVFRIPNAVDAGEILEKAGEPPPEALDDHRRGRLLVTYAGRLSREKGLGHLVAAAGSLPAQAAQRVRFAIVGSGEERSSLMDSVRRTGLEKSFLFLDYQKNVYPCLASSDAVVLPSLSEGMPVVVLEAMALKIPVIASRVGGVPDVVRDGETGILVPPGDAASLARAIVRLMDPGLRAEMGERGSLLVREKYGFDSQAEAYAAAYRGTVEHGRARGLRP